MKWLFVMAFVVAALDAAWLRLSPANDEPLHLRAGLTMLTGSRHVDPAHAWWTVVDPLTPPFDMLPAALALGAGERADFRDHIHPTFTGVRLGRMVSILLGAGLLLLAWHWAGTVWGPAGGVLAMAGLLLQPIYLAHASIVSTDLAMAVAGAWGAWLFWKWWIDDPGWLEGAAHGVVLRTLACGGVLGACMAAKVSNCWMIGLLLVLGGRAVVIARDKEHCGRVMLRAVCVVVGATLVALGLCAAVWQAISPPRPPMELFGRMWQLPFGHALFTSVATALRLHELNASPVYFLHLRPPSWKLFAVALALKTHPLMLLGWCTALIYAVRQWHSFKPRQRQWIVYVGGITIGLGFYFSTRGVYLGLRHLLLPLTLAGMAPAVLARPVERWLCAKQFHVVLAVAVVLVPLALIHPWYLSYFNPAARVLGRHPLVDSDSDWGQGLLALREWQREHNDAPLWLAYFGNARPEEFGIEYRGLLAPYAYTTPAEGHELARDPNEATGYVAISATQLAGTLMPTAGASPDTYAAWRNIKPMAIVGDTIYVYDRRTTTTPTMNPAPPQPAL